MKRYFVYIMSSRKNGALYVGITNDIARRVYEHKNNLIKGFTEKYSVHNLVYIEVFDNANTAIEREKKLKRWKRNWNIILIEKTNPQWNDLYDGL